MQFGFNSVNRQVNSGGRSQSELEKRIERLESQMIAARVTDIILDSLHPAFDANEKWNSIGTIFFEKVETNSAGSILKREKAKPFLPSLKNYPVVNEIVLLFSLPSKDVVDQDNDKIYYYLNPISIWNHPNLNAYPDTINAPSKQASSRKTPQEIEDGQTIKPSDEYIPFDYNSPLVGGTFEPSSTVKPLLPYAGDVIVEGRWGNSIRFGSTTSGSFGNFDNNWSKAGSNGNPITIIRNGQGSNATNDISWIPTVENINEDNSSIYLTSNQEIPLLTPVLNNPAVKSLPPQSVITYQGSQILLNSDRLVFNTKADSIILNSQQSVSIASKGPIGLYSQNNDIVLQTSRKNVRLGDSQANQPVIKGDSFLRDFEILLKRLEKLSEKLTGEPYLKTSTLAAGSLNEQVSEMLNSIQSYKSKIVKIV